MKVLSSLLLIAISWPLALGAQTTGGPSVVSLFDASATAANVMLPFFISGAGLTDDSVISGNVASDSSDSCGLMRDPYHRRVFHLKCKQSADVRLSFVVQAQGQLVTLNVDTLHVMDKPGVVSSAPTPTPTPTATNAPDMAQWNRGRSLWVSDNCANCHSLASKIGTTLAKLNAAIANRPEMQSFSSLTTADRTALITYLSAPTAY